MNRLAIPLLLACVASAPACGTDEESSSARAASDGDAGSDAGSSGYDDVTESHDDAVESPYVACEVSRRADTTSDAEMYLCESETGVSPWTCRCGDDDVTEVTAESCEEAIPLGCGVPAEDNACDRSYGVCVAADGSGSDDDGGFDCRCDGSEADVSADGERCDHALFAACAPPCALAGMGGCEPSGWGAFDCTCDDGRSGTVESGGECTDALRSFCSTGCSSETGECFVGADNVSFDCRCVHVGEFINYPYDELGHDSCDAALIGHCGAPNDEPETCEATSADGTASGDCRINPDGSYSCNCATPTSTSSGAGSTGERLDCMERLRGYCPEAFE